MIDVCVRDWAAWAPGLAGREAWTAWAASPKPLSADGAAEARFLPSLLRRRCTPLTRAMLTAAFECAGPAGVADVRSVFASRHGSINESIQLLENVADSERMSPSRFTHTVHNAQSGLFSIAAANHHASSALSARAETFANGFLEAVTHLHREPDRPVLLVMGDVPLSEPLDVLVDEPIAPYSVALLLAKSGGQALNFAVEGSATAPAPSELLAEVDARARGWADAPEFLRWLLSGEERLALRGNARVWSWVKG